MDQLKIYNILATQVENLIDENDDVDMETVLGALHVLTIVLEQAFRVKLTTSFLEKQQ